MWYRMGKFTRRNRAVVAIAASLLILLTAGAWRERALRYRAETRRARPGRWVTISSACSRWPIPIPSAPGMEEEVTARALLEQGVRRVDSSLSGQPEVQAELRGVFGRAYTNLGLFDQATVLLRQSLAQHRRLHGEEDLAVAEDIDRLGEVLAQQDKYDEAEPLLREALAQRRRLLGSSHELTAELSTISRRSTSTATTTRLPSPSFGKPSSFGACCSATRQRWSRRA